MAEIATESPKAEGKQRSLKNLKPFKRGGPIPKSPGRPKKMAWLEEFKDHMSEGNRLQQLFNTLRKKKPDVAMAYLAGKPVETMRLGGADDLPPIAIAEIEAASAIARRNRGMDGPSSPQDASRP